MKRAPRSLQHHVLYRKYNGQDSEISALLGKCGLDLDLGGQTPDGELFAGTFNFMPAEHLGADDLARAAFSIDVLGLNREVMCVARANAFGGFRARLVEYRTVLEQGGNEATLVRLRDDLLNTHHLTVFAEMRRQRASLPEIDGLFAVIPEALTWPLTR